MTKQRTPTKILEMRGAFKKNPQRRRTEEPQPEHLIAADPPDHWAEDVQQAYRDIVGSCVPGVLTDMDTLAVEVAARSLAQLRHRFEEKGKATMADARAVYLMLGKLGMNPSDRSGLSVKAR